LRWAKGYTLAGSGVVSVSWKNDAKKFEMTVSVPNGYRVNLTMPEEIYGWNIHLEYTDSGENEAIAPTQKQVVGIKCPFKLSAVRP